MNAAVAIMLIGTGAFTAEAEDGAFCPNGIAGREQLSYSLYQVPIRTTASVAIRTLFCGRMPPILLIQV
jgi:hypothetical protein